MPYMLRTLPVYAVLASIVCAQASYADILAGGTRKSSQNYGTMVEYKPIFLNENGDTKLTFSTLQDNTKVSVVYNAECSVGVEVGFVEEAFLYISIMVDGRPSKPASGDAVFCSSTTTGGTFTKQVVSVVKEAGVHEVSVAVLGSGPASKSYFFLDDSSIVIYE
jgi:hypothetical protein